MAKNVQLTQGPPVKGDDFYDREEVVSDIWKALDQSSIFLVAPRRFGKTSIMLKLRDNPINGFIPIFLDIEHVESADEFIIELIEEIRKNSTIWNKMKIGLTSFFKTVGVKIDEIEVSFIRLKLRDSNDLDWKNLGKHLMKLIIELEINILFILDEFPEMIKLMIERDMKLNIYETSVFLGWFRKIRLTLPDSVNLRFIVGGSICLEHLLDQIDCISKINDMTKISVRPFSNEVAKEFIQELCKSENIEIDEDIPNAILDVIGIPVPYFIQIMVKTLQTESRNQKKAITPEFVLEVYEQYLLGTDYKSFFQHYYSRLREYYTGVEGSHDVISTARSILTEISICKEVKKEQLYQIYLDHSCKSADQEGFGELMSLLETEFYLEYMPETTSYRFFSKLLMDWWYRHFGMLKNNRGGL